MARRSSDPTTPLLDWQPPPITRRYPDVALKSTSLGTLLAKAVRLTLKDCGMSRADVAQRMSDYLGETISENMLDNYASEARADTVINGVRITQLSSWPFKVPDNRSASASMISSLTVWWT